MLNAIMGNKASKPTKPKPASTIDGNTWYHVSEGRVDRGGKKFSSMLQIDNSTHNVIVYVRTNNSHDCLPLRAHPY